MNVRIVSVEEKSAPVEKKNPDGTTETGEVHFRMVEVLGSHGRTWRVPIASAAQTLEKMGRDPIVPGYRLKLHLPAAGAMSLHER